LTSKVRKRFKRITREDWESLCQMLKDNKLGPNDILLLRFFFALINRQWAYMKENTIFINRCISFCTKHKENISYL